MDNIKKIQNPEWKNLYDSFSELNYNTQITYTELDSKLKEGSIKTNKRYVFEKFKKEMLRQKCKALENVINVGYRIVNPNEHVRLTNKEIKRAERRARTAVDTILHTDVDLLTEKERAIANLTASRVQPILASLIGEQKALKETKNHQIPYTPRS